MALFRSSLPVGDLDKSDWEAIQDAVRVVYETERLRRSIAKKRRYRRDSRVSKWSDIVESALSSMSWVRELHSMATGATHPTEPPSRLPMLMRRHGTLAARLLNPDRSPARRLSTLVELGGLEISLMGSLWALRPIYELRIVRIAETVVEKLRARAADKKPLTESEFDKFLRAAKTSSKAKRRKPLV